jgi:hypothetical protein
MKHGEKSWFKQERMGFHGMFTNPKNGSNAILLGYNQQIRAMGPPETGGYLNLRPSISEVFPLF